MANGVLDAAAQETSLDRFTGGIGIPIFSISLFAQIAGDCSSASGSATVVLSIVSKGGVFGLSVLTGGASVGVGGSCGIDSLVCVVCCGSTYLVGYNGCVW